MPTEYFKVFCCRAIIDNYILSPIDLVSLYQGRNMVYPGPTDPYFLAVILIPEPHFPQNFDP